MFEHVLRHSMVLWFRNLLIGLLSLCAFEMTQAQVTSAIDTTQIRIGEEINLTIEAVADTTALVLFPEGKTFGSLEVIDSYKIDTALADSKYRLIKRYGLTQFDSGHYTLPALRVMIGDRAFNTDSVAIEVLDVPVDTTQQKMFDIKPAIEVNRPPFDWMLLLYWVAPILVVIGLVWFFLRRKKLKEAREKQLPPYEEAMVALQQLDASNLLKDEKEKEYYSSLTEIVKRYLDREVDDRALESTSDELIERLLLHKDAGHFKFDQETIRKLDAILKRADLVKFAKMRQDFVQAQADRSSVEAIINETKEALPEPTEEELRQNEAYLELLAKRKKRRQWAYGISGAIGVLLVAALVYGSITGFDNLRDRIFGNEMRSLAEGRWYKSEYGTPAVIVETPEVLKRILLIPQDSLQPSPKNEATFEAGNLKEPFYVRVTTTKLSQQVEGQQIDLNHALDQALNALEAQGAKNMIVKREDFETEKGIKGLKAYGEFHVLVSENKVLKEKSSYDLLIFAQEGGLQTVLLVYQDDGVYAEQVKNRILDSVELEVTNEGTKKRKLMWDQFEFVNPEFFWLLLVLPLLVLWYFFKRYQQTAALRISSIKGFKTSKNWLAKIRPLLFILRLLALSALIVAMARPRMVDESTKIKTTSGIDIVMAIDVSASMLARDLKPNRLEALKDVAAKFINARPNDRIGLVEYAGESYTKTPLTSDKGIVLSSLKSITYNTIIEGGTAIGMGLATAVNRLKESRAKSKVIILLTDGVNNTGFIDPRTAGELAVEFGIKVYTIGLGTNGMAVSPIGLLPNGNFQYGNVQVEIDEGLLKEIAQTTGGKYFRATSNTKLNEIYDDINQLEKTEIEEFKYKNYDEQYRPLALLALGILGLELLLRYTLFRSFV